MELTDRASPTRPLAISPRFETISPVHEIICCVSTELEGARLRAEGVPVLVTGVGPVNAACALAIYMSTQGALRVVVCGVGGAYPGSGLAVGDVVCAESEQYGDLGADSPDGFLDMQALGIPVLEGDPPLYNRLPVELFPIERRAAFVTVNTCTGSDEAARAIVARTGGAVESMEGAAFAHVARHFGVPVAEVRGISNLVGDRDRGAWRIAEAADAAQEALLPWLLADD